MPYIKKEIRDQLREDPSKVMYAGELNYLISKRLLDCGGKYDESCVDDISGYINNFISNNGISYNTYNSVIGVWFTVLYEVHRRKWPVAEDVLLDFDELISVLCRTKLVEYEDKKIKENGDI